MSDERVPIGMVLRRARKFLADECSFGDERQAMFEAIIPELDRSDAEARIAEAGCSFSYAPDGPPLGKPWHVWTDDGLTSAFFLTAPEAVAWAEEQAAKRELERRGYEPQRDTLDGLYCTNVEFGPDSKCDNWVGLLSAVNEREARKAQHPCDCGLCTVCDDSAEIARLRAEIAETGATLEASPFRAYHLMRGAECIGSWGNDDLNELSALRLALPIAQAHAKPVCPHCGRRCR